MKTEQVKDFLASRGFLQHYMQFDVSSATVELAAQAVGCAPEHIVKTLAFKTKTGPIVICVCGAARVDNQKFKAVFGEKAVFPHGEEVETLTGHPAGGVCPFALNEGVRIYLDESIRPFDFVYPAAGAPNNAVKLTPQQLQELTQAQWVNIAKHPADTAAAPSGRCEKI